MTHHCAKGLNSFGVNAHYESQCLILINYKTICLHNYAYLIACLSPRTPPGPKHSSTSFKLNAVRGDRYLNKLTSDLSLSTSSA
eukprot:3067069-Amphidinium_carterae.1